MRDEYAARLRQGSGSHQLVVVPNQRRRWKYLDTSQAESRIGRPEILAPLGLADRWLIDLWPDGWNESLAPQTRPSDLTVEGSQYILTQMLREAPHRDAFVQLELPPNRLAIEIIHAGNRIAAAGLSLDDAAGRMLDASPDRDDGRYAALVVVLRAYQDYLIKHGFLDYSVALTLFDRFVTNGPALNQFVASYDWMLCDGYDEWPAVMQRLALRAAEAGVQVHIFGDPEGGHSNFENAEPQGFLALNAKRKSTSPSLGAALASGSSVTTEFKVRTVETNYSHEMWRLAGEMAQDLFTGTTGRIAVTAPRVDQVNLAFLSRVIPNDSPVQRMSTGRRIVDQPMARAILGLALLCHPTWLLPSPDELPLTVNLDDLSALWAYTCNLDPVRGAILSRHVLPHAPELPSANGPLVDRIGAIAVAAYERLADWVKEYRSDAPVPVSEFVRRAFAELMAVGRMPSSDSLAADRLARTAERFEQTFGALVPDAGRGYCGLLREGYIGAQFLADLRHVDHEIVVASAFTLALSDLGWDALIILDLSSSRWFSGTDKPLFDSQVLSPYWPGGRMTEDICTGQSRERAYRLIGNLLGRTSKEVILMASELDVHGFEQSGELYDQLCDVLVEESLASV